MTTDAQPTGLERRERTGSQKRAIGFETIKRMLPKSGYIATNGVLPERGFMADNQAMGMEDSYCDMWTRTEVLSARERSIATVSLMVGVGNVGNQFELEFHVPAAYYNGVTLEEIGAIMVHARAYVGSPAGAWASTTATKALTAHGLLENVEFPKLDLERREAPGSHKRRIAREVLAEMDPGNPLINVSEDAIADDQFAAELDYIILENCYFDLWARTDVLDRRTRSIVTLGMLMGLGNHTALRTHVPIALRNGVTKGEMEEIVYQAATYLGFPNGLLLRDTMAAGITDAQ